VVRCTVLLAASLLAASCATAPPAIGPQLPYDAPDERELAHVPFFPQEDYQCGPAALATVLTASGIDVTADALTRQVYLPGRRGSLQTELIAATRRHGRLPYRLEGGLPALLAQVDAGHPVVVLQNLGFKRWPRWHYAVVVGYSAADDTVVLRSGTTPRLSMPAWLFQRTWRDSNQWALMTLPPDELPAEPDPDAWVEAAAALEATGKTDAAHEAFAVAVRQWPDHPAARLGLANTLYQRGDAAGSEEVLRELVADHPDYHAARNNLGHVLAERGCTAEAREVIGPLLDDESVPARVREVATRAAAAWPPDAATEQGACTAPPDTRAAAAGYMPIRSRWSLKKAP